MPNNLLFVRDNMGVHMALMNAERFAGITSQRGLLSSSLCGGFLQHPC